MQVKKLQHSYFISDYLTTLTAWIGFFYFRRIKLDPLVTGGIIDLSPGNRFYMGIALIPFFWILVFYISGFYVSVVRKSRFEIFSSTFITSLVGSVVLFFTVLLDDLINKPENYIYSLAGLFTITFLIVLIPRNIIYSNFHKKIHKRKIGFNSLIIGGGKEVQNIVKELAPLGSILIGLICLEKRRKGQIINGYKCIGTVDELEFNIKELGIEEVILAPEGSDDKLLRDILNILYRNNVLIKVTPAVYDKLIGIAKLSPVFGTSFMDVARDLMPPFEENLKRIMDIVVSLIVLIILSPIFLFLGIKVKTDSPGSVIYKQERIGKDGKPFMMLKFRTMYSNAEKGTPLLTIPDDQRVTKFGSFMRKYRLDELPQFINVLLGDMSIVGPRPERKFFIDQIVQREPNYFILQKIRPGITSLGMVKYGYADSVEKMIERLKFDIIYIENMSIVYDLRILFYTIQTIITGKGV